MQSFVYGTKCNNILDRYYCNNIAVTTTKADTSAKCNTVVHDSTCCTKCNNNDWSYPGNCFKCCTIIITVLLLWSYPDIHRFCADAVFERFTDKE